MVNLHVCFFAVIPYNRKVKVINAFITVHPLAFRYLPDTTYIKAFSSAGLVNSHTFAIQIKRKENGNQFLIK